MVACGERDWRRRDDACVDIGVPGSDPQCLTPIGDAE